MSHLPIFFLYFDGNRLQKSLWMYSINRTLWIPPGKQPLSHFHRAVRQQLVIVVARGSGDPFGVGVHPTQNILSVRNSLMISPSENVSSIDVTLIQPFFQSPYSSPGGSTQGGSQFQRQMANIFIQQILKIPRKHF